MSKFALYTKGTVESRSYITSAHMDTLKEAKAYFMGMKRLSNDQFDKLYHVDIIEDIKSTKGLLFGNQ